MNEKKYTKEHEWIELKEDIATIGISNHAQESLGDIVFVDLPKIGEITTAGSEISVIESVKAASDIYSPVDGEIVDINNKLTEDPSLINKDSENSGWIFKLKIKESSQLESLMNYDQYKEFLKKN